MAPSALSAMSPMPGSSTGLAGASSASVAAPAPRDVQQFQKMLGQPASFSSPVATPDQAASGSSLSDAVSSGLKQAAESYRSRFDALQAGLKRVEKTQSITSLLAWQLESAKMGVEMEFTGKIVSKVVQDVEQLTKQQG